MYLLDTNVVSELRRPARAHPAVREWASRTPLAAFFLSAVSVMELEIGVRLKERTDTAQGAVLRAWLDDQVLRQFAGRILAIDTRVAQLCAPMHVPDRCSDRDAFIAATALAHSFTVVTRNVADFEATGATVYDPWNP